MDRDLRNVAIGGAAGSVAGAALGLYDFKQGMEFYGMKEFSLGDAIREMVGYAAASGIVGLAAGTLVGSLADTSRHLASRFPRRLPYFRNIK